MSDLSNQWTGQAGSLSNHACYCIGPQHGEPLCPCKMRGVIVKNGRYVQPEVDLGEVIKTPNKRVDPNG